MSKSFFDLTQAENEEFAALKAELQTLIDAPYFTEASWERHEEITSRMWEIISIQPQCEDVSL